MNHFLHLRTAARGPPGGHRGTPPPRRPPAPAPARTDPRRTTSPCPRGPPLASAPLLGSLRRAAAGLAVAPARCGGLRAGGTAAGGLALAALVAHGGAAVAVHRGGRVGQRGGALGLVQSDDLGSGTEGGRRRLGLPLGRGSCSGQLGSRPVSAVRGHRLGTSPPTGHLRTDRKSVV